MAETPTSAAQVICFGVFEVDLQAAELRKNGVKVKLQEQPFQILNLLLERPGKVVTREEIQHKLWPDGTFVDFEHSLNAAVKRLREVLGDSAETPRFVETIPRRGYRFIYPVERPGRASRIRQVRIVALAVVALLAVLIGLNVAGLLGEAGRGQITSIAVLPLANLSGDPEQEYFVDGMTETLITELSKIGALTVISRQSVMRFKGTDKPLPEIARELNVDAVVEGSALHIGERVRITVQLIEAATDRNLWAENYDREMRDILALHSEVAQAIAGKIKIAVTPEEQTRLASARLVNPAAHEAYLKGRYYRDQYSVGSLKKSIEYFQQALDIDPAYAPAYAGLASSYGNLGFFASWPPEETTRRSMAAALKALELDEMLAEAHAELGAIKFSNWDWFGPEPDFKRSLELNPNSVDALLSYAYYLTHMGRFDEGIAAMKRAVELDPLTPSTSLQLGWFQFLARRYDDAIAQVNRTLELAPNYDIAHLFMATIYAKKEMYAEAIAECEKALALLPPGDDQAPPWHVGWVYAVSDRPAEARELLDELKQRRVDPAEVAIIYAGLGETDRAFEWLDRAYAQRSMRLVFLKVFPTYDPLRSDPRFQALLRRMNFPE